MSSRHTKPAGRPGSVLIVLGALVLALVAATPARGQLARTWESEAISLGERVNLFATWEGQASFDGVVVELPEGWSLERVTALRYGYEPVRVNLRRLEAGNRYVVWANRTLRSPHDLVLQVTTGGDPALVRWTLTPFSRLENGGAVRLELREAFVVEGSARQVQPVHVQDNRVLAFDGPGEPVLLRSDDLPDVSTRASFTVEFWMRTTGLDEVVLSTWDGDERSSYPFEVVIDAAGRLRYYRGRPGQHESMRTRIPVADGRWHHVAVTHDAENGWTRLLLDGTAADSLFSPAPRYLPVPAYLAVGGRVPAGEPEPEGSFTGQLDELRFWKGAQADETIHRMMRERLASAAGTRVVLDFEEDSPARLVDRLPSRAARVLSDLAFYQPVSDAQAVVRGESVLLTWETRDRHTTMFTIERSTDGKFFEPVGRVEVQEPGEAEEHERSSYLYRDEKVSSPVVYYRIRQHYAGGAERLSVPIKLGLGAAERDDVELIGNFPNPFNPSTTIGYRVHTTRPVQLAVWDLSGQLVAVLVNKVHAPGYYEVPFDGHDLPSGTYFVRLETPDGVRSRKMILSK